MSRAASRLRVDCCRIVENEVVLGVRPRSFGAKAVILVDSASMVAKDERLLNRTSTSLRVPDRTSLARRFQLDEPAEMPKRWRCCASGTCTWRPTHLVRVNVVRVAQDVYVVHRTVYTATAQQPRFMTAL